MMGCNESRRVCELNSPASRSALRTKLILMCLVLSFLNNSVHAEKKPVKVTCPKVIGNLSTGEFSASKNNYKCFQTAKAAEADGLVQVMPTFASRTFSGTTNQSTPNFATSRPALVTYNFVGKGHFAIVLRGSADGDYKDLLANDTDSISGSISIPDAGAYYMDVDGVGQWTITIAPR